jgi:hypothetical protein
MIPWEDLTRYEQEPFIIHAKRLVENGYLDADIEELAEKIYIKKGPDFSGPVSDE